MLSSNRKLINKIVIDKRKSIKDLEQAISNEDVTNKQGVPRNTVFI